MPRPKKETVNKRLYKSTDEHLAYLLKRAKVKRPNITLIQLMDEIVKGKIEDIQFFDGIRY